MWLDKHRAIGFYRGFNCQNAVQLYCQHVCFAARCAICSVRVIWQIGQKLNTFLFEMDVTVVVLQSVAHQ